MREVNYIILLSSKKPACTIVSKTACNSRNGTSYNVEKLVFQEKTTGKPDFGHSAYFTFIIPGVFRALC